MGRGRPDSAHLVDVPDGPLAGRERIARVLPFAGTAIAGMAFAIPATTWSRPSFAIAGCVLSTVTMAASILLPWERMARWMQAVVPFAFLVSVLLMGASTRAGLGSPFIVMSTLPLLWLAIYEDVRAVVIAAIVAGLGVWLGALDGPSEPANSAAVSALVLALCAAGMGITLAQLVSDARRVARDLRTKSAALEDAAQILDSLPERVNRYRVHDHVITYCNASWGDQYGVAATGAVGRPLEEFLSPDEMEGLHSQLQLLGPERPILVDPVSRAVDADHEQWLQWLDRWMIGMDGPEILSIGRDVTDLHRAERMLADSEARFRDLADRSADVVWRFLLEPEPRFDYVSPAVEALTGYPPAYFLADYKRLLALTDAAGAQAIVRGIDGAPIPERRDFRLRRADGRIVIAETRTASVRGGLQGVSRDVTELRELQAKTAELALRDPLTGLANRRLLDELLAASLARTERVRRLLAVAFIDLDGFKSVNDLYGHVIGDVVLCEVARRLVAAVRGADTVARVGGDEFVIVFEPQAFPTESLIQRIERALAEPVQVTPGVIVRCSASIGVADTHGHGYEAALLIDAADKAMYAAKRKAHPDLAGHVGAA